MGLHSQFHRVPDRKTRTTISVLRLAFYPAGIFWIGVVAGNPSRARETRVGNGDEVGPAAHRVHCVFVRAGHELRYLSQKKIVYRWIQHRKWTWSKKSVESQTAEAVLCLSFLLINICL